MTMKASVMGVCVLVSLLTAPAVAAECLVVDGPVISVSALLPFVERTPALPMDRILASTPDPGTRRWITAADLRQWGLAPQANLDPPGICVERQLKPLPSEDVKRQIQEALHSRHGDVQLLGISSIQPSLVPAGHLSLPPTGFQLLSADEGVCSFLWRGSIEFDTNRRAAIKVLGRYQAEIVHFVAKRDLLAGDVLGPDDYARVAKPGCPHGTEASLTPPEGSIMRRALIRGDVIETAMLKVSPVVDEGAVIRVIASAGGASVSVEAIAERSGRRGENIFVRNKDNGKRIRVRLIGKGVASAIVAGAER
jgi:flagella basal body P-ring formation protein FlgA